MEKISNEDLRTIDEKYICVSETRIKYTIRCFKSNQPWTGVLNASFASAISFLIAFASYWDSNVFWKWIFLACGCISAAVMLVAGIVTLVRIRRRFGTEQWFLEEITNEHPTKYIGPIEKAKRSKKCFNFINAFLLLLVPGLVLLIFLACNNWSIVKQSWAPIFWVFWIIFLLSYIVFGTYLHATLAYVLFGYEDGFPDFPTLN